MKKTEENYLERVPKRSESIGWSIDDNGIVTLEITNKGVFNTLAQKLLKKPRISYVHLDENGSFVWTCIDGKADLIEIGRKVEERFGEASHPLYERLSQFFSMLESYKFIEWIK